MIRLLFWMAFLLGGTMLQAQHSAKTCFTDELTDRLKVANPAYAQALQQEHDAIIQNIQQGLNTSGQRVVYTIPVVFHVVYNNAAQNVPNSAIYAQLETLNKDFRRRNADTLNPRSLFAGVGDDVEIEFCLAKRDPLNNSVLGITRTYTSKTEFDPDTESFDMKYDASGGIDAWNTTKYLNVWIVNLASSAGGSTAGYAYLGNSGVHGATYDGIVLDYSIGFGGGSRTLTHEVGHYLGLRHTWGNSQSCASDDGFADTPTSNGPKFGCDLNSTSCGSTDMIENYMDYADCSNMFTVQQAQYMRSVLTGSRASLLTSDGCTAYPNSGFYTQFTNICTGSTIQFIDTTFNDPASWQWTFPGGTPATSTLQNPSVYYPTPGTYTVTLRTSNAYGLDEEMSTNYITVGTGGVTEVLSEDFESGLNGWTVFNTDNSIGWTYSTTGGNGGANAVGINLFNYSSVGERDGLHSPVFDMSGVSGATLEMDYAYRPYSQTDSDSLIVYVSTDGGATFPNKVFASGGSALAVGGSVNSNFVPAEVFDWCSTACINVDLSAFAGNANVRLRIESYNGYGNNIYVDNVLVYGACVTAVANNNPPQAEFSQSAAGGCGNTTIQFTDESLFGATSWQWIFPGGNPPQSAQQNPSVNYSSPGTYNVTLTSFNANGNDAITKTATVTVVDELVASATQTEAACAGATNGSALVSVSGGVPGYNYLWSSGETDSLATGLAGGQQSVLITDQLGCEETVQLTITENPGMILQYDLRADQSSGNATPTGYAEVVVKAGTGTPPFTYQWSNGENNARNEQLAGGTYEVTVQDATGCFATVSITVPGNDNTTTGLGADWQAAVLANGLLVYPNPATQQVTVQFAAHTRNHVELTIFNVMGQAVLVSAVPQGTQQVQLSLDNFETGVYLVAARMEGATVYRKLIVNK